MFSMLLSMAVLGSPVSVNPYDAATPIHLLQLDVRSRLLDIHSSFQEAYKQKHYVEAAALGLYAIDLGEKQPDALYNTACALSLSGDRERAFNVLDKASRFGFTDFNLISSDSDLVSLHMDPRWSPLLSRIEKAAESKHRRLSDPSRVEFVTSDIPRFWAAYDKAMANPADKREAIFQHEYLDRATPGMQDWIRVRKVTARTLTQFVNKSPKFYASARDATLQIATQRPATLEAFRKFKTLYPQAEFPNVAFSVGAFYGGGTVSNANLLMSAEMYSLSPKTSKDELGRWQKLVLTPTSDIPFIVAHEMIHFQQRYTQSDQTLLAACIEEGAANFLGSMCSGGVGEFHQLNVYPYGDSHEKELWDRFQKDMGRTDKQTVWLYSESGEGVRPDDLGYYMGHRICESYYKNASDKRQAINDILNIKDFKSFLAKSRYSDKFRGLNQ